MDTYTTKLVIALIIWNLIVFSIYGIDKLKAQQHKWRISEKTLILLAIFMGAVGAYCGMKIYKHKTKHTLFKIGVPTALLFNILLTLLFWKNIT